LDERRNIQKSTEAAILYLADLYDRFHDWNLAAAAYNAGETKVARAIRRFGTRDFWAIARHRFLKVETRNYVPKIIAAAIIDKNRTLFGFPETFNTDENNSLSATGNKESENAISTSNIATPHISKKGVLGEEALTEIEVEGPADLFKIAKAAGLPYQQVKNMNPEILRWCTPPGLRRYRIKLPEAVLDRFLMAYYNPEYPRQTKFRSYVVKRGDTIRKIARRFGIHAQSIRDLNGLSRRRNRIISGKKLFLPIPGDRRVSYRLLDITDHRGRRYRKKRRKRRSYKLSYKQRKQATRTKSSSPFTQIRRSSELSSI